MISLTIDHTELGSNSSCRNFDKGHILSHGVVSEVLKHWVSLLLVRADLHLTLFFCIHSHVSLSMMLVPWNRRSYSAYNPPTVTGTGAFAKNFIVNLIFRALAVVEIFRCLPTCDRKLSNCFPWCLCLLTETVPSVRGAEFWTKYAFKLATAFR